MVLRKMLLLGIVYHIRRFCCLVVQLQYIVCVLQSFDVPKSTTETTLFTAVALQWCLLFSHQETSVNGSYYYEMYK